MTAEILFEKVVELGDRMARIERALAALEAAASPALDPRTAARLTGSVVGEKAIRAALASGELPSRRIGHGARCPRYVFSREAFIRWLEGRPEETRRRS